MNNTVKVWNCAVYDMSTAANCAGIRCAGGTVDIYNCTVIGGETPIFRSAGTMTATNCYAAGSSYADYYGAITKTNCASEDDTGDDGTHTDCLINQAYDTTSGSGHAGFVSVTAGNADFLKLKSDSYLVGKGTDSVGGLFTTDIRGLTRSSVYDIGAFEYVASGPTLPVFMHHYLNNA